MEICIFTVSLLGSEIPDPGFLPQHHHQVGSPYWKWNNGGNWWEMTSFLPHSSSRKHIKTALPPSHYILQGGFPSQPHSPLALRNVCSPRWFPGQLYPNPGFHSIQLFPERMSPLLRWFFQVNLFWNPEFEQKK